MSSQCHRRSFNCSSESRSLRIEGGQELLAHGTEEAFDLAAAFGLIGRRVDDEDADGSGDAGQLRGAVDLGVVHVEADGDAAGGDGLAQTVEEGVQALVGIELGVRDEAAGIVESGMQEDLHFAARRGGGPRGRRACRTARSGWRTRLRTFCGRRRRLAPAGVGEG